MLAAPRQVPATSYFQRWKRQWEAAPVLIPRHHHYHNPPRLLDQAPPLPNLQDRAGDQGICGMMMMNKRMWMMMMCRLLFPASKVHILTLNPLYSPTITTRAREKRKVDGGDWSGEFLLLNSLDWCKQSTVHFNIIFKCWIHSRPGAHFPLNRKPTEHYQLNPFEWNHRV